MNRWWRWTNVLLGGGGLVRLAAAGGTAQIGWQVVPRDAFPVFDNPRMLTGADAEARRILFDRDMVIGVAHGQEAKAYPITIMGVHELGNDTIGGVPIAVTW
jgi:Protein of unknown function (DUF3179)